MTLGTETRNSLSSYRQIRLFISQDKQVGCCPLHQVVDIISPELQYLLKVKSTLSQDEKFCRDVLPLKINMSSLQ